MKKEKKQQTTKKDEDRLNDLEKNQIRSNQITAVLLILSLILSALVAIGILPITDSPNTIAYETITRNGEDESYQIFIYNLGKIAHNLRIEIEFPSNTTYYQIEEIGSELTKTNENIDPSRHYYYVTYSVIQEKESVGFRFLIENYDLKNDDSLIIKPSYIKIWTDEEGQIEIK